MLKFLLILTALATLVLAQRRDCDVTLCPRVSCRPQFEEDCKKRNEEFRLYDGICFCCDACIPFVPEGGICGTDDGHSQGNDYYYESCVPGTTCRNGTCTK